MAPRTEMLAKWQVYADEQLANRDPDEFRCETRHILDEADLRWLRNAEVHFEDGQMAHDQKPDYGRRNCRVGTLEGTIGHWIRDVVFAAACLANDHIWRHPKIAPAKWCLWNHYPTGGFITWHPDTEPGDPRTFTTIVLINRAEGGGELAINGIGVIPLEPGHGVTFPAHIMHRVIPVHSGTRDSLTLWSHSPKNLL